MLTIKRITDGVNKTVRNFPVDSVYLFGSYADGTNDEHSDVDLLVYFKNEPVSLLMLSGLKIGLKDELGTDVDIVRAPLSEQSFLKIENTVKLYERTR